MSQKVVTTMDNGKITPVIKYQAMNRYGRMEAQLHAHFRTLR
jgi:hypothetical protein